VISSFCNDVNEIFTLPGSGMLCSIDWWLDINIIGQPISPISKGPVVQEKILLGLGLLYPWNRWNQHVVLKHQ